MAEINEEFARLHTQIAERENGVTVKATFLTAAVKATGKGFAKRSQRCRSESGFYSSQAVGAIVSFQFRIVGQALNSLAEHTRFLTSSYQQ